MAIFKDTLSYIISIYDIDFDLVANIIDYTSLQVQIGINEPGVATLKLPRSHHANALMDERYMCEVHVAHQRRTGDTVVFAGELERVKYSVENGKKEYTYIFAGLPAILQREIVAWTAGTDNRSSFTSEGIHDIIENVIQYNHLFGTTALGRERTSDNDHVQFIEYSAPGSPITIDYGCAWRNVYDVVLSLLEASGYELEWELDTTFNRVLFSVDYDGLGTDKSDNFFLSEELGTILSYEIVTTQSDYKNVAIVGGGGQESERTIVIRTSADYSAAVRNAEMFVDARQTTVTSSLEAIGDSALIQSKHKTRYTVDLAQPFIGRLHPNRQSTALWLGDSVNFIALGTTNVVRIVGMAFDSTQGQNSIRLTIED